MAGASADTRVDPPGSTVLQEATSAAVKKAAARLLVQKTGIVVCGIVRENHALEHSAFGRTVKATFSSIARVTEGIRRARLVVLAPT